jgi:hypothetical protein
MDKAEWLIEAFKARSTSPVASKLDASIELERLGDRRVVAFWLHVLAKRWLEA